MDTLKINDKTYICLNETIHAYVLVRTQNAGVHVGRLYERIGDVVTLVDARRIWYWKGAFTLSEMSQKGVANPDECKFSIAVPTITILGVIEIIPLSDVAKQSLYGVVNYEC